MHFVVFRLELFFRLFVSFIGFACIYRAHFDTFGRIVRADAFCALIGVNLIYRIALADSLIRALSFARSATDAFIGDLVSHLWFPPLFLDRFYYYFTRFSFHATGRLMLFSHYQELSH